MFPAKGLILALSLIDLATGCGSQRLNERKSSDPIDPSPQDTRAGAGAERDTSAGRPGPRDDISIDAPSQSAIAGTKISGRFRTEQDKVAFSEALSVGSDVLGAYLQVRPTELQFLSKAIYVETPADPNGDRNLRLTLPVQPTYSGLNIDESTLETAPQIAVIALTVTDSGYQIESFRSNKRLRISNDSTRFIITVNLPGSYQVMRIKNAEFPELKTASSNGPRKR